MQEDATFADLIDGPATRASHDDKLAHVPTQPLQQQPAQRAELAPIDIKASALSRFGAWRAGAALLVAKYHQVIFADMATTKGYDAARAALAEVRAPRFAAQNVSRASKSELAAVSKAVGAEEAAVITYLADTEAAIKTQIDAEDHRREAARLEAARLEALRVAELARLDAERRARHEAELAKIRSYVAKGAGLTSDRLAKGVAALEVMVFGADQWEEFADQAAAARDETMAGLRQLHADTLAQEQRAAAAEAQRAVNERVAAELAEKQRAVDAQMAEIAAFNAARAAEALADQPLPTPAELDAELERETGEAQIDGWPLHSGLPTTAEPAVKSDFTAAPAAVPTEGADQPTTVARLRPARVVKPLTPDQQRIARATALGRQFGGEVNDDVWAFTALQLANLIDHLTTQQEAA